MPRRQRPASSPGGRAHRDLLSLDHLPQRVGHGGTSPATRSLSQEGSCVALLHIIPCTVYSCIARGQQKRALAGWRRNAVPRLPLTSQSAD